MGNEEEEIQRIRCREVKLTDKRELLRFLTGNVHPLDFSEEISVGLLLCLPQSWVPKDRAHSGESAIRYFLTLLTQNPPYGGFCSSRGAENRTLTLCSQSIYTTIILHPVIT